MRPLSAILVLLGLLALSVVGAQVNVPLTDFRAGMTNGFEAKLTFGKGFVAKGAFSKRGEERRLLAVQARPVGNAGGAKALVMQYDLAQTEGAAPQAAVLVFDKAGCSWYRIGEALKPGAGGQARVSLAGMRATAFSADPTAPLAWGKVSHLWLGFVVDGAAKGSFTIGAARLTDEPYVPSQPLVITGADPGTWSVGQDPAVVSTLTTPNEGPEGKPCMKYEFTVPAGRHMYCIPSAPVPSADLEGYTGLRFTYKATIPEGMGGLLVTLNERGNAGYLVEPSPPPSADWTTITIPFSSFKLAGWTKDDNNQFDLADVVRVSIGCHGAARGENLTGTIMVTDVQFAP